MVNLETAQNNTIRLVAGIVILIGAVFVADLLLPLGVADGVLYVAPVALSLWLPGRHHTAQVAIACAVLTILGFFLSPPGTEPLTFVLINRGYSLFAIGMIVLIDRLQRQLIRRNVELAARTSTLEALYEIGTGLSALLDVNTLKETAVRRARQLLDSDTAGLALLNEHSEEIRWHLLAGAASDELRSTRLAMGQGLVGKTIQSGQPTIVENMSSDSEDLRVIESLPAEGKMRAALVVPVRIAGKPVGALMVGYHDPRSFHLNDVKLLTGLANQVAVAINNANLHERLKALSALEERQRLAREMHDGLAQLLGHVTARATATYELLGQGRTKDAQQQLNRLRDVAQKAYVDVRQAILGLRTPSSDNCDLLEALREFVQSINEQEGMRVRVETPECVRFQELEPAVEVQAIRIIQEALSNARKHSQAQEASIKIDGDSRWLTITIHDDGRGFNLSKVNGRGGHFGLQMMRERAESVGGRLSIETTPGSGTSVIVQLPLGREE